MVNSDQLKRKGVTAGAMWVALLSVLTIGAVALVTWCCWDFFIKGDTPTNVFRNMGLQAAGIVALVFAFWRGLIAKQQEVVAEERSATARLEHLHGRFERALELFAKEGVRQSAMRISGMHALRYLVRDAPEEFAVETVEIVTTFMVQAEVDSDYRDFKEFRVAHITANYVCELLDKKVLLDGSLRSSLRSTVASAVDLLHKRLRDAGMDPEQAGI